MATYPLVVAQHRIEGHPRRTEHWNIVAIMPNDTARIYGLVGNYDTFSYSTTVDDRFSQSESLRGGCKIGEIPVDSLDSLEIKLQEVKVIRNNPDFDCQTWVMDAIWILKENSTVIIDSRVNERFIREELKIEDGRWEAADETLFERLIS